MHNLASFADITYFHKVWNQIKHWAGSGSKLFDTDLISVTCTDPESFVREGPTLTIFFFFFWGGGGGGEMIQANTTISVWCFAGVSIMAQNWMLAW